GNGLLPVALFLDETAFAGAVSESLILQRALAALIADRTVQRVVDKQELQHALLGLFGHGTAGVDLHPVRDRVVAGWQERRSSGAFYLDQAHSAHADRLHPRVVAEPRDVHPSLLGGLNNPLAGSGLHLAPVEGYGDALAGGGWTGWGGAHGAFGN